MVEQTGIRVVGLWRYPVKSLQGEALTHATLEHDGLGGDRTWGLRDENTGRILTARRRPELLAASAVYDDGPVITLPDGEVLHGPGEATDRALSAWLGSPVALVPSLGTRPGRAEFFEDATDDSSAAIEWTMPPGRFVDAAPLLVLTTASLRTGASLHSEGAWDPRRFRPNLLLDVAGETWVEDDWVGRRLAVGEAELAPAQPCVRCTMVTRPQDGLPEDRDVFRTLARHHGGLFGVWTSVVTAGAVRVGDPVVLGRSAPVG